MQDKTSQFFNTYWPIIETYALRVVFAIIFLWIGFKVIKIVNNKVKKTLSSKISNESISKFLDSLIVGILKLIIILTALSILGVEMTTFAAVLASVGLAIGLALSGTLQNFAGGVVILLLKPFKVGDYIKASSYDGTVEEISIFHTYLQTVDNKRIVLPNSDVSNSALINFSHHPIRRVDFVIGIDYNDDIKKAKETLVNLVKDDPRILADKPVQCMLGELGDSSVNILFRVWTAASDYWPFYWETLEKIKYTFDENDITFPFPQRDVHVYNEKV